MYKHYCLVYKGKYSYNDKATGHQCNKITYCFLDWNWGPMIECYRLLYKFWLVDYVLKVFIMLKKEIIERGGGHFDFLNSLEETTGSRKQLSLMSNGS